MAEADRAQQAVVIEDDPDIRDLVSMVLRSVGLTVHAAPDATTGLDLVREHDPDLVTLDLGLPDIDGLEACRRIRTFSDAYVVMLTARAAEIDTLLGLESGADDYVVKPFSPRELGARVTALLRRPRSLAPEGSGATSGGTMGGTPGGIPGGAAAEPLRHGDLLVDEGRRLVTRDGEEIDLTKTEYDLLVSFLHRPDQVLSKADLLAEVWGITWAGDAHLVETHMGNLRRKLGERSGEGRYVRTVRGVGYRLGSG